LLPSLIAVARQTHNATGIFLLNLFLGWTGIGWIIAMILALCSCSWPYHHYYYSPYPPGSYPPAGYQPNQWPPPRC
jgi:hypothetical protein